MGRSSIHFESSMEIQFQVVAHEKDSSQDRLSSFEKSIHCQIVGTSRRREIRGLFNGGTIPTEFSRKPTCSGEFIRC
uniref:Uncharacterized protein n=1 Tax=Caenorhabditis tropicalis TaxID=1561998 RepID=A0A1I7UX99_9PELO